MSSPQGYITVMLTRHSREIATGAHMDPWPNFTTQSTAYYIKHQAEALSDLLPCLRGVRFMRICGGLADMTPDMAPILDAYDQLEGLYVNCGWGYFGFKSFSAAGRYMAEYMATGNCPDILKPFNLRRYDNHQLMGETAALVNYGADNWMRAKSLVCGLPGRTGLPSGLQNLRSNAFLKMGISSGTRSFCCFTNSLHNSNERFIYGRNLAN